MQLPRLFIDSDSTKLAFGDSIVNYHSVAVLVAANSLIATVLAGFLLPGFAILGVYCRYRLDIAAVYFPEHSPGLLKNLVP